MQEYYHHINYLCQEQNVYGILWSRYTTIPIPSEIPLSKYFSPDRIKEIDGYVKDRVKGLINGLKPIREEKITQWRRIWAGTPREKVKSFPWQNASNVVIQLVGSYEAQLTAKLIMGIFGMEPFWIAGLEGDFQRKEKAEEQRNAVQKWLAYRGLEPSQLNLLPKYEIWARTFIKYGYGVLKTLPALDVEQVATRIDSRGNVSFSERVRHDGPVCTPLLFEDWLMPATTVELERSPILAQRCVMQEFQLRALLQDESYDHAAINEILKNPDRYGPDAQRQKLEQETGAKTDSATEHSQEWDIYQCWLPYQIANKKFHLIIEWHDGTQRAIKRVFNWLPDNSLPYVPGCLGADGERTYGFGYCEMLKDYQEEITAIHNRRGDASTLSNTNLLRVAPGLQLDSNFSIFPNAMVSGDSGQLEVIPLGRNANETIKDEEMSLRLATDRAGVGPSSSGAGAGTVNKKNQYSAMGTFQTMSEGNTRANLHITSFRHSHYCVGRTILLYDSRFGIRQEEIAARGKEGVYLQKALDNYKKGRIILPIRAATGTVNSEVEKQNLMLLLNNVRAHGQQLTQLLQAAANPMNPPEVQHFLYSFIAASNLLMERITRSFIQGDVSAYLPEPLGAEEKAAMLEQVVKSQLQPQGGQPGGQQNPQQPGPQAVQSIFPQGVR